MPIGISGLSNQNQPNVPLAEGYGKGTGKFVFFLIDMDIPIPSYYSNAGIKSAGPDGEGHWMNVFRNGARQIAGIDYSESPVRGSGQIFIVWSNNSPPPAIDEMIEIEVFRF